LRDQVEFHSVRRFRMPSLVTFYSHVCHLTKSWTYGRFTARAQPLAYESNIKLPIWFLAAQFKVPTGFEFSRTTAGTR
jgi:hypothetical protein